jgi:hypothetical protein
MSGFKSFDSVPAEHISTPKPVSTVSPMDADASHPPSTSKPEAGIDKKKKKGKSKRK